MKTVMRLSLGLAVLTVLAVAGCMDSSSPIGGPRNVDNPTVSEDAKKSLFDKNLYLETQGGHRRVLISATVCRRQGLLEMFLCRTQSKEHESILVADVVPERVHTALLAAGAEEKDASPVQYEPKFRAPQGQRIRVTVQYEKEGRRIAAPAQSWVHDGKTNKELSMDWVFTGGLFRENPLDAKRPKTYAANSEGTLICLANFESAVLDVPFPSAKGYIDGSSPFEPITDRIPPLDTPVTVILEPLPK
jgi:hypothetical protein